MKVIYRGNHAIADWRTLRSLGESGALRTSWLWLAIVPPAARAVEDIQSPLEVVVLGEAIRLNVELPFTWQAFFFSSLFLSLGSLLYQLACPNFTKRFGSYAEFKNESGSRQLLLREALALEAPDGFEREDQMVSIIETYGTGEARDRAWREIERNLRKIHPRVISGEPDFIDAELESCSGLGEKWRSAVDLSTKGVPREWLSDPLSKELGGVVGGAVGASSFRTRSVATLALARGLEPNRIEILLEREADLFEDISELSMGKRPFVRTACAVVYGIGFLLMLSVLVENVVSVIKAIA